MKIESRSCLNNVLRRLIRKDYRHCLLNLPQRLVGEGNIHLSSIMRVSVRDSYDAGGSLFLCFGSVFCAMLPLYDLHSKRIDYTSFLARFLISVNTVIYF